MNDDLLEDREFLGQTVLGLLQNKIPITSIEIPEELSEYIHVDCELGIPRPRVTSLEAVPLEVLENLMLAATAWADYLRGLASDMALQAKQVEANIDMLEHERFMSAAGSIELRKRISKQHPDVRRAAFDLRVLSGAVTKLRDFITGLEGMVGTLKYAHKSSLKFQDGAGNVYR